MRRKALAMMLFYVLVLGAGVGSGLLSVIQGSPAAKVAASTLEQGMPPPVPTGGVPAQAQAPDWGGCIYPDERFVDVQPQDYFYDGVEFLCNRGAVWGYHQDAGRTLCDSWVQPGELCYGSYKDATRADMMRALVVAEEWGEYRPANNTFADVPSGNAYYGFIEQAKYHGIINGYPCGGPGEPCYPDNKPYFRPSASLTRGQASKVVVLSESWLLNTSQNSYFTDVLFGSTWFPYVQDIQDYGLVVGYNDYAYCTSHGAPGQPCYLPQETIKRGQMAKVVYLSNRGNFGHSTPYEGSNNLVYSPGNPVYMLPKGFLQGITTSTDRYTAYAHSIQWSYAATDWLQHTAVVPTKIVFHIFLANTQFCSNNAFGSSPIIEDAYLSESDQHASRQPACIGGPNLQEARLTIVANGITPYNSGYYAWAHIWQQSNQGDKMQAVISNYYEPPSLTSPGIPASTKKDDMDVFCYYSNAIGWRNDASSCHQ